jgi:hypothetical protein
MGAYFIILHDTILLSLSQQTGKHPIANNTLIRRLLQRNSWRMPTRVGFQGCVAGEKEKTAPYSDAVNRYHNLNCLSAHYRTSVHTGLVFNR